MSEKNLDNLENEVTETAEEVDVEETVTEAVAEETEEVVAEETNEVAAEEVIEEAADEVADAETITEAEVAEVDLEQLSSPAKGGRAAVIAGGIVAILLAIAALLFSTGIVNPYEWGYVDTTGVTLKELADKNGYTLKEYKKANGLSVWMHSSTFENAVNSSVKLKTILEQSGMPLDEFKKYYGWGDEVTEESTVGEALGATKLSMMVGEEAFDQFKEYYGFGDEVTLDTTYAQVRKVMDTRTREDRLKQEEEEKNADAVEDEGAEPETDAETAPETEAEPEAEAE